MWIRKRIIDASKSNLKNWNWKSLNNLRKVWKNKVEFIHSYAQTLWMREIKNIFQLRCNNENDFITHKFNYNWENFMIIKIFHLFEISNILTYFIFDNFLIYFRFYLIYLFIYQLKFDVFLKLKQLIFKYHYFYTIAFSRLVLIVNSFCDKYQLLFFCMIWVWENLKMQI